MHVASSRDFALISAVKLQVLNTLTSILTGIVRPRVPCVSRVCPVCVPCVSRLPRCLFTGTQGNKFL